MRRPHLCTFFFFPRETNFSIKSKTLTNDIKLDGTQSRENLKMSNICLQALSYFLVGQCGRS